MAIPAWKVSGQYYETCSCDFVCPCLAGRMAVRPTKGSCTFAMAFQVDRGHYDAVSLDGEVKSVTVGDETYQARAGAVAEVRALKGAADDLGDVEPADDGGVPAAAGEEALVAVVCDPLEIGAVALARERRVEPPSMKAAAGTHQGDELVLIGPYRRAEQHARRHTARAD